MLHLLKVCNYEKVCIQAEHTDKSNTQGCCWAAYQVFCSRIPAEVESFG